MNIALIGYGKMGKLIHQIIINSENDKIGVIIDNEDDWTFKINELKKCDVAIEFSEPKSSVRNIIRCFENKIPVVCGTTGWYENLSIIDEECKKNNGSLIYASNFSIGVNIFMMINKRLANIMSNYPDYKVSINEEHHIYKLDAPSGTAITLAEQILSENKNYKNWNLKKEDSTNNPKNIEITALRQDNIVGNHRVLWQSENDEIFIEHKAKSRTGFAKGAIIAANWIINKKGVFNISDIFNYQ